MCSSPRANGRHSVGEQTMLCGLMGGGAAGQDRNGGKRVEGEQHEARRRTSLLLCAARRVLANLAYFVQTRFCPDRRRWSGGGGSPSSGMPASLAVWRGLEGWLELRVLRGSSWKLKWNGDRAGRTTRRVGDNGIVTVRGAMGGCNRPIRVFLQSRSRGREQRDRTLQWIHFRGRTAVRQYTLDGMQ
ncbi:hypothetical protein K402DRAFT_77598 [Aulographum hederae CBS 113979]|uniref:Uncharacterized protein n=1 Tax=Aulographum hederae CBS 113979 TaxID=1176131 RepID=A0A6G1HG61_9PEZI|nr:hypothetical protein K402DRAFT_77598 [Aulographum hederae CBS 113979]